MVQQKVLIAGIYMHTQAALEQVRKDAVCRRRDELCRQRVQDRAVAALSGFVCSVDRLADVWEIQVMHGAGDAGGVLAVVAGVVHAETVGDVSYVFCHFVPRG